YTIWIARTEKRPDRSSALLLLAHDLIGKPLHAFPNHALAAEQVGRDLLAGVDQALDGADRLVEGFAILAGKLDLDNALHALAADHDGHADIHVLHAVFAIEIGGAGHHALLVAQIALGHRDRRGRRRIERRAGLQEVDDLGAAIAG